ncbi:hypothetical protein PV773_15360 [Mesorhizobium sp. CC13]|uniref:hypothetical protein n=1 Tax=Mesorhizobium sp. CC13 TaxID=3029194 RepID=UPI0032658B71
MIALARKRWSIGAALAVALIVMLKTTAGALTLGQGSPPLDMFGNPLCITSIADHTAPAKSNHASLPQCCTLGCNMFATPMASPPDGAALPAGRLRDVAVVVQPARLAPPTAPDHDPGRPRAPPMAA